MPGLFDNQFQINPNFQNYLQRGASQFGQMGNQQPSPWGQMGNQQANPFAQFGQQQSGPWGQLGQQRSAFQNLNTPEAQNDFLGKYKTAYMSQLQNTDPRYKQLNATAGQLGTNAYNTVTNYNKTHPVGRADPNGLAAVQRLQASADNATAARDAYTNPLWAKQEGMLKGLFSGQITPEFLLQLAGGGLLGK